MKINNNHLEKILGVYKKQGIQGSKAGKTAGSASRGKADKIELSAEAKDFQIALKALAQVPDIRESKVADIKTRLKTGKYNVSAEEVASKIIDSLFIDKKA